MVPCQIYHHHHHRRIIIIIMKPVGNVGMGVNVIVASVPSNFEVASLSWMGLTILMVKTIVMIDDDADDAVIEEKNRCAYNKQICMTHLGNIDSDKVGHL